MLFHIQYNTNIYIIYIKNRMRQKKYLIIVEIFPNIIIDSAHTAKSLVEPGPRHTKRTLGISYSNC